MAFPTVHTADTTTGTQTSNASTWTMTYPANIVAGNLLIMIYARDGGGGQAAGTAPWIAGPNMGEGTVLLAFQKRLATGSETGTFSVSVGSSEQGCWAILRISGWEGTIGTVFTNSGANDGSVVCPGANTGSGTSPDPPSLDPVNWATEDTLWIAAAASDHGDTTYTGFPTGYTTYSTIALESGGAGGAGMGVAFLASATSTQNPGTFTTDASEGWSASVMAIRPAADVAQPPRYGYTNFQDPGVF